MGFSKFMKTKGGKQKDSEGGIQLDDNNTPSSGSSSSHGHNMEPRQPPTSSATPSSSTRPASLMSARPTSMYPAGDFRNSRSDNINDIKCDVMVNYLHQQQLEKLWTAGAPDEGVVIKKTRGQYTCCPSGIADEPSGFFKAIETLNVRVAMTVNTSVIKLFLQNNDRPYVPLPDGLRLQVLPDVSYLPRCQKHQFAAFIADRGMLVVWDDEPKHLVARAADIERTLMDMIWKQAPEEDLDEKRVGHVMVDAVSQSDEDDVEKGYIEKPRQIMLWTPVLSALTLCLTTLALGLGYKAIAVEIYTDGDYLRLLFVLVLPAQFWLGLFFFQALVGNVAQLFGPVSQVNKNTRYYSGVAPRRLRRDDGALPHVTIQMPVYKEGLYAVIEPTVRSLKAAISTYELQGGTANIFINDDGMQLVSEEDAKARQDFYDEHNIGWCARPKHNPTPKEGQEPFLRRGKFKKASNMNYAMWCSNRVEDKLKVVERHEGWTQEDEASEYRRALAAVVEEDEGRTWADGNIRMGDYILIIDSDTRVPTDCFLDCVSEMEQCPDVAILQYSSGVMNVTDSYFERGITFFTHLIYTQIRYSVANGDVAPFVGHNAILRWSAMQEIAYECQHDHIEKYWSEETVSEDFDMALRLQTEGYLVRFGAYFGNQFQEGVSLTVYDELARWEKYAYGCNELVFHPLRYWFTRGPFTKLFRNFIGSRMPLPSKLTIMAYVGTYYAIASAWILTFANYWLTGLYNGDLDHYYLNSFKVYIAIVVVFTGLGNISLAVLRYRTGEKALLPSLVENFSWIPLLMIFLGGISIHVSQAILSHMFGIDMSWGSTSKEATNTTFFKEVPRILKGFWVTFVFCFFCVAMMIVMAVAVPEFWKIDLFISIYPLSTVVVGHFLLPICLNPGLMRFTW